ncbi:MAG TPA: cyclic nucleotide-binding domain-containing protein [Candidatus Limnocylindrales bacterium]|nr:cyclic nucleotide-binding domain-containing protein [Candidatus Limnocylindrales bacterium]
MAHELLSGLSPAEMDQVMALGVRMIVPGGDSLFRLGDRAESLFLIERGRVRLTLPMQVRSRESDVLIEEKSPGQTVGWSALIPPYRFTLSATASQETEVVALSRQALQDYCEAFPAVGYKIALNLAIVVGHRLQMLQAMWLREMQRTIEGRSAWPAATR